MPQLAQVVHTTPVCVQEPNHRMVTPLSKDLAKSIGTPEPKGQALRNSGTKLRDDAPGRAAPSPQGTTKLSGLGLPVTPRRENSGAMAGVDHSPSSSETHQATDSNHGARRASHEDR